MVRNMIKLGVLACISVCSLEIASHYLNAIVIEVEAKEKTIADALIKQQVQESLKEAEQKIEQVVKEENIVIETEEIEMKPSEPPKKIEEVIEVVEKSEPIEETIDVSEEVIIAEGIDATSSVELDIEEYDALTKEEVLMLGDYLVDNYFLHGYVYYNQEEDPIRRERKKLAHEMEVYVIESISGLLNFSSNLGGISSEELSPILTQTQALAEEFEVIYENVGEEGEVFESIYKDINTYFEMYIQAMTIGIESLETIEQTANKALVLPLILKSLNQEIMPAAMEVLDQGFALKEKTNAIYLEGIDTSFLLTKEEVIEIISNPDKVLQPSASDKMEEEVEVPVVE